MGSWRRWIGIGRRDVRRDVEDELRFHLDAHTADLIAAGLSPGDARREAERRFGDVAPLRRRLVEGDTRRGHRRELRERAAEVIRDVRLAARVLRRTPLFTGMAVASIALGVGLTTTVFSAFNGILLHPLRYARDDELLAVYAANPVMGISGSNISWSDYVAWRDENRTLSALGLWTWNSVALSGDADAERVDGAEVTVNLFPLLGVQPVLGRNFTPDEAVAGRARVILIGHALWQRRFNGDPGLVNRSITVDGLPYLVVGIMPPGFAFPDRGQVWVPYLPDRNAMEPGNRFLAGAIGRMNPGVTRAQATADLDRISNRLAREAPRWNEGWHPDVMPLRDDLTGDLKRPVQVFGVAVVFLLLIACANVAGLMLARGTARRREIATRASLGAHRGRLVRQLVTESVLLALVGGAVGGWLATFGVRMLATAFPDSVPFYLHLAVDRTALLFTAGLSLVVGLLFGAWPAFRATRLDLAAALRDGGRGGDGPARTRARSVLVVAEVALAVVLTAGGALLVRSYRALTTTDLGFDEQGILSARLALPGTRYAGREQRIAFYTALLERLRALPGVEIAASAQGIPFSGWNVQGWISIEGRPVPPRGQELDAHFQNVTPGYLTAIGAPIVRGRGLTEDDRDTANVVVVINETMARRAFPGEDPIGRRLKTGLPDGPDPWATVVGVVRDFRHYRLPQPMGPAVYYPFFSWPARQQDLVLRTSLDDPATLVPALHVTVRALDPEVPIYNVRTFEQVVSRSLWRQRLQGQVVGLFAVLALGLAAIGLYGVIAYSVTRRTRELGVRMTLGASRSRVIGMVLREAARLGLAGIGAGVVAAFWLTRFLAGLLYEVKPADPATIALVAAVLLGVTLLAGWLPARRAAAVDPAIAMRAE